MALFDMMLVIFMVPASLCNTPTGYVYQGDCDPVGVSDLGNPGELSTEGLIARSFGSGDGGIVPQLVRIIDFKIVCEVAGLTKGTIRGISVIATYDCMGLICSPSSVARFTSQFNFYCRLWGLTLVIEGLGRNDNPTGTTETPLDITCGLCATYSRYIRTDYTNDSNCFHCNVECTEGQRRCLGYDPGMCCNWYLDGICQVHCPTFFRGNPDTFICEPIANPVLCYTFSNCTLRNENDQALEGSFNLQNETATCCRSGYESFSIAETERCILCVDIDKSLLAPINPTPGALKACNVACTAGIFVGVLIVLGASWGVAFAIGYLFTRMTRPPFHGDH